MNPMQMMQAFTRFRNEFRGDPRAEVQKLLQSGRINQQQLDQLQVIAQQFQRMLGQ